jgi:hypothetical protein
MPSSLKIPKESFCLFMGSRDLKIGERGMLVPRLG